MPLWKCNGCGFEVKGNCRPKECPDCGAPKDNFLKAEEAKPAAAAKPVKKVTLKPAIKATPKPVKKADAKPVKKAAVKPVKKKAK